jgi:hypothetical protein
MLLRNSSGYITVVLLMTTPFGLYVTTMNFSGDSEDNADVGVESFLSKAIQQLL